MSMNEGKPYRLLITIFFIGILCTTIFIQNTGLKKKFSSRSAEYSLVVKSSCDPSSANQKQMPFGSNLVNEEEEETHVKTETIRIPETKSFIILLSIRFSPPSLFFKEHPLDVTSPPPWA